MIHAHYPYQTRLVPQASECYPREWSIAPGNTNSTGSWKALSIGKSSTCLFLQLPRNKTKRNSDPKRKSRGIKIPSRPRSSVPSIHAPREWRPTSPRDLPPPNLKIARLRNKILFHQISIDKSHTDPAAHTESVIYRMCSRHMPSTRTTAGVKPPISPPPCLSTHILTATKQP